MDEISLENALQFPVMFSQVREDPFLDLDVLRQVGEKNLKVLMIASGGCTLSTLASHRSLIDFIDAVDANPAQIALCKLKMALLKKPSYFRGQILGHTSMPERKKYLIPLLNEIGLDLKSFGEIEAVCEYGPDYVGRYEWLFKAFSDDFKKTKFGEKLKTLHSLEEQRELLKDDLSEIQKLFEKHFDLDILTKLFGNEAVQNKAMPYSQHFYRRFIWSIENQLVSKNPFFNQFAYLCYPDHAKSPYLSLPVLEVSKVNYYTMTMVEFLQKAESNAYHFVHLSNILDWLSKEEIDSLLKETARVLKPNGNAIIRQLNSSVEIQNSPYLHIEKLSEKKLIQNDLSFFYPKIYTGGKNV